MSHNVHSRNWPGDPDRPALALHCMLGSANYWGPIASRLDYRIDLQAFDMPGHGRSAAWKPGPDNVDFHTQVTRIAARFVSRPLDLIGHSLGATVALRIAVAAPEAIRSLTLIEPVLFAAVKMGGEDSFATHLDQMLTEGNDTEAARIFIGSWGVQSYDGMSEPVQAQMRAQVRLVADTSPTLYHDRANILREGGIEAIDAPVMLIAGGDSPGIIHEIADALALRMGDVARATVPNAGHMLPITHPDAVADLIAVNLDRA